MPPSQRSKLEKQCDDHIAYDAFISGLLATDGIDVYIERLEAAATRRENLKKCQLEHELAYLEKLDASKPKRPKMSPAEMERVVARLADAEPGLRRILGLPEPPVTPAPAVQKSVPEQPVRTPRRDLDVKRSTDASRAEHNGTEHDEWFMV
ncbi:hypothetical protein MBLNU457_1766t2 [Dothideomycetes sp. NU457]